MACMFAAAALCSRSQPRREARQSRTPPPQNALQNTLRVVSFTPRVLYPTPETPRGGVGSVVRVVHLVLPTRCLAEQSDVHTASCVASRVRTRSNSTIANLLPCAQDVYRRRLRLARGSNLPCAFLSIPRAAQVVSSTLTRADSCS